MMSTPIGASTDDSDSAPLLGNQNIKAAAEQIEERPSYWAYLKYIVIWNVALVVVSFPVLVLSREEKAPARRLWWWLAGYVIQSLVNMACVSTEFLNRRRQFNQGAAADGGCGGGGGVNPGYSVAVKLNTGNSVVSGIWRLIGFNWLLGVNSAGAPQLYWLCAILLASDVFPLVVCVAVVCALGIAFCCLIGIERIRKLWRGMFQRQNAENTDSPMEDAECST